MICGRYFKKENRIFSGKTKEEKKQNFLRIFICAALFVFDSFLMWDFLYNLCNIIGSIVSGTPSEGIAQALREIPQNTLAVALMHLLIWYYRGNFAVRPEKRKNYIRANAAVSAVLGLAAAVYVIAGCASGFYFSLIEGHPTALYPLDMLIWALLLCTFSVWCFANAENKEENSGARTAGKCFAVKIIDGIFCTFSLGAALCTFAGFIYGIFTVDFAREGIFFDIVLLLNYLTAVLQALVFLFVYRFVKDELKRKAQRTFALSFLIFNIVLFVLYFVSVQLENEAPNLNAIGILPVEYTASFHAFPLIFGINNVVVPLGAFVKSFFGKKKEG